MAVNALRAYPESPGNSLIISLRELHCFIEGTKVNLLLGWGNVSTVFVLTCAWSLSHVRLFETRWPVAHQVPLSMGILQASILEQVAMPSSRGSSQPRD